MKAVVNRAVRFRASTKVQYNILPFLKKKKNQSSLSVAHFVKVSSGYTICIRELDVCMQAGFGVAGGTSFYFFIVFSFKSM